MLYGASMCKQQSDCHLIRVPLKSVAATPEWDSARFFSFQGQLFFSPSAGVRLHIRVNNPSPLKRSTPAAPQLAVCNVTLVSPLLFLNYKSKSMQKVKHFLSTAPFVLPTRFGLKARVPRRRLSRGNTARESSELSQKKVNSKKVTMGNYYLFSISDQTDFSTGGEREW